VTAAATRILALDPGTKRIGVALSDELGWTAQPLETFERTSLEADLTHIKELVRRHGVREIVVGMPVQMDGRPGPAAQSAQQFLDAVQAAVGVPVVAWDERLTTKAAEQMLIEADVSRKKRKGVVDRVAAALLLKSYLEQKSSPSPASDGPASCDA
jgi:putative Holliday junction resolvase